MRLTIAAFVAMFLALGFSACNEAPNPYPPEWEEKSFTGVITIPDEGTYHYVITHKPGLIDIDILSSDGRFTKITGVDFASENEDNWEKLEFCTTPTSCQLFLSYHKQYPAPRDRAIVDAAIEDQKKKNSAPKNDASALTGRGVASILNKINLIYFRIKKKGPWSKTTAPALLHKLTEINNGGVEAPCPPDTPA